eukprot:4873179-Karenia_brevis.AAC.1
MGFGENGWEIPPEEFQKHVDSHGGNPCHVDPEGKTTFGPDLKDDRINIFSLCERRHDSAEENQLEQMI